MKKKRIVLLMACMFLVSCNISVAMENDESSTEDCLNNQQKHSNLKKLFDTCKPFIRVPIVLDAAASFSLWWQWNTLHNRSHEKKEIECPIYDSDGEKCGSEIRAEGPYRRSEESRVFTTTLGEANGVSTVGLFLPFFGIKQEAKKLKVGSSIVRRTTPIVTYLDISDACNYAEKIVKNTQKGKQFVTYVEYVPKPLRVCTKGAGALALAHLQWKHMPHDEQAVWDIASYGSRVVKEEYVPKRTPQGDWRNDLVDSVCESAQRGKGLVFIGKKTGTDIHWRINSGPDGDTWKNNIAQPTSELMLQTFLRFGSKQVARSEFYNDVTQYMSDSTPDDVKDRIQKIPEPVRQGCVDFAKEAAFAGATVGICALGKQRALPSCSIL